MPIEQPTAASAVPADLATSSTATAFLFGSAPPAPQFPLPPSATLASAIARVERLEGSLVAVGRSDIGVELGEGDIVGNGDVLIAAANARALLVFEDGATVALEGATRAEVHAERGPDEMHGRIVVYSGSLVIDAAAAGGGRGEASSSFAIETSAATVRIDDATVALSFDRSAGLETVLLGGDASGEGGVTIVNDSGEFVLHRLHAPVAVDTWLAAPRLVGAPDHPHASADGAPASHGFASTGFEDAADPDGQFDTGAFDAGHFETGAGEPSAGDLSFIFPEAPRQGLADHPAAADTLAPTPAAYGSEFAAMAPAMYRGTDAAAFAAGGHAPDALFLYAPPPAMSSPAPLLPLPPPPPRLSGWEPGGHAWDIAGVAGASSGGRELPADPDRAYALISPREGGTMAVLEPRHAARGDLEQFLGLPDTMLNGLVDGAHTANGSAIRAQYTLHAGQVLSFDVLFDAVDTLPKNDFAAFTVADGSHGEAFVISSVTATGSLGATPWQTIRYTAGHSGPVTVGFVVINDATSEGLSRLYIDGVLGDSGGGESYELADWRDDSFGGRFELLAPKSASGDGGDQVLTSFEASFGLDDRIGSVSTADTFHEPDGARGVYAPSDGESMAVLKAYGASRAAIEAFLELRPVAGAPSALPADADGSASNAGAATRLSISAVAGDQISFDWMFDAGDRLPDNDYCVFTIAGEAGSQVFKLSDVRQTGAAGASGWQTSVYTVAADGELTLGFAVINDRLAGFYADDENSRLLVDNVRLNRDFGDGYQLADHATPGALETLATPASA